MSKMQESVDTCCAILSRLEVANRESHPTSMRILTPPSSSRRDEDAGEVDCAPSKGTNWNIVIVVVVSSSLDRAGGDVEFTDRTWSSRCVEERSRISEGVK